MPYFVSSKDKIQGLPYNNYFRATLSVRTKKILFFIQTQQIYTCSRLILETLEKNKKYVQS